MPEENDLFDENLAKLLRGTQGPPKMDPRRKQLALDVLRNQFRQAKSARERTTMKRWIRGIAFAAAAAAVVAGFVLIPGLRPKQASTPKAERVSAHQLADGTRIYARPDAKYTVVGDRRVRLDGGQVLLFVAKSDRPFVVDTPQGQAKARGTIFTVSAGRAETFVAVGQGRVDLSNAKGLVEIRAGQQAFADVDRRPRRTAAPRFSHLVNWARKHLGGEKLFKPDKAHATGELVAVDPWGREVQLELRKYNVDVVIEDGIARTTVDQTYFNHLTWQIEGTFYFPLPPDASLSRLAMYVSGKLNEGGMVDRDYGRYVYESIVYRRRDPALLEMMEGNVFKMRVFPIFGRREKRILISYTQTLPELYRTMRYWFPMEKTSRKAGQMSIRVRVKNAAGKLEALSSTHEIKCRDDADDLLIEHQAENVPPSRDFLLRLTPRKQADHPELTVTHYKQDDCNYVFARWRPQLRGAADGRPRQWFIINDVSASRSTVDVKAQAYILERLLAEADDEDGFALVNLDTRPRPWRRDLIGVRDPHAISAAAFAEPAERMGATNIRAALAMVSEMIERSGADNPHVVYLGDGIATDGATETNHLVAALPADAVFIGLGVGKKVDARFLQAAADASGGLFAPINPNEDIRWRMFDMVAALNTPRLVNVHVTFTDAAGNPMAVQAYPSSGVVSDGEALTILARTGDVLPAGMTVRGLSGGATVLREFTFDRPRGGAAYIPRLWASARINHLLTKDALGNKQEIVALSKYYYVVTPFTSLIVLENEADYKKWNVEMGRKDHWQLYPAPKEIPVVHEPLGQGRWDIPAAPLKGKPGHPKTIEEIVQSVQFRVNVPFYGYYPHQRRRMERFRLQALLSGRLPADGHGAGLLLPVGEIRWEEGDESISGFAPTVGTSPGDIPPPMGMPVDGKWRGMGLGYRNWTDASASWAWRGSGVDENYLLPSGSLRRDGRYRTFELSALTARGTWEFAAGKTWDRPGLGLSPLTVLDSSESMIRFGLGRIQRDLSGSGMLGGKLLEEDRILRDPVLDKGPTAQYTGLVNSYFRPLGRDDLGPVNGRALRQAQFGRWWEDRERIRQYNRRYGGWYYGEWDMDGDRTRVSAVTSLATNFESLRRTMVVEATDLVSGGTSNAEISPPVALRPPGRPMPPAYLQSYARTVGAVPGTLSALTADRLLPLRRKLQAMKPSQKRDQALAAIDGFVKKLPELSAATERTGIFWSHQGWSALAQPWDFQQPQCQTWYGSRAMTDVTRYASALESTWTDVAEIVLAAFGKKTSGKVDDQAAGRIAAARGNLPTMRVKYVSKKGEVLFELWAGRGDRFAWTGRSSMYLREDFVCDGQALHHVYPELGLAARRTTASRRIAALRGLTPHVLPPADQLARDFNVQLVQVDGRLTTVRLTPITPPKQVKPAVLVTFDGRGFLHRQVWQVDGKDKLTCGYSYKDSRVQCVWKTPDKTLLDLTYQCEVVKPSGSPFTADLAKMVVLDMPLRRADHYAALLEEIEKDPDKADQRMRIRRHLAVAQLQDHIWQSPWGHATAAYQTMLAGLKDRAAGGRKAVLPGDLTIVGSTGYAHSIASQAKDLHLPTDHPLWTYWGKRGDTTGMKKLADDNPGGFVGHLATHAMTNHGGSLRVAGARQMMKGYPESPLLYAAAMYCGANEAVWLELAQNPRWRVLALLTAAQHNPSIKVAAAFDELDKEMTEKGWEVPVSSRMVAALKHRGELWRGVLNRRLAAATKHKDVGTLLRLAELAWPHGEKDLAAKAIDQARELIGKKLPLTWKLAVTHSLSAMGRAQEAWDLHKDVLAEFEKKGLSPSPALLAMSARLAQQAGQNARAVDFELKAIEAERPYMPKRVNVHLFRQRYQWLWSQLTNRIQHCAKDPGKKGDLQAALAVAKDVWETWKRVDTANSVDLYGRLAALYRLAGDDAAAWRAVSSVIDEKPKDGSSYYSVGQWHVNHGQRDAGQQWYAKAYQVEPTNGDWIWRRATLLQQMGRKKEAETLYKEIAAKKWQPRFQHYNNQAKKALEKLKPARR